MSGKNKCEILYTCANGFNEVSQFQLISGKGVKKVGVGVCGKKGQGLGGGGERQINCRKQVFKTKDHLHSAARPRRSI